jgi:hypothetical protein
LFSFLEKFKAIILQNKIKDAKVYEWWLDHAYQKVTRMAMSFSSECDIEIFIKWQSKTIIELSFFASVEKIKLSFSAILFFRCFSTT